MAERSRQWIGCAIAWNLAVAAATTAAPAQPAEPFADEDFKIPLWYPIFNLRGGPGYKDNVLLGSVDPQGSGFWKTGAEALVYRLPTRGWQLSFFATVDDIRYFNAPSVDDEQVAIVVAQVNKDLGRHWKTGVAVNYLYQNQVFDVSTTQDQLLTGKVLGHALTGRWRLRKELGPSWIEADLGFLRQWLDAPLDDYSQLSPRLTAGRHYGHGSDVTLAYQWSQLDYDTRMQVDPDGISQPGTSLTYRMHTVDMAWHHVWDADKHWQTIAGAGVDLNLDNGSGYYDYRNYRASARLKYQASTWELGATARIAYYDFPVQPISPDDPTHRQKTWLTVFFHAEKKFTKSIKVFADYSYDRSLSNLGFDEYTAHTLSTGVDYEF